MTKMMMMMMAMMAKGIVAQLEGGSQLGARCYSWGPIMLMIKMIIMMSMIMMMIVIKMIKMTTMMID